MYFSSTNQKLWLNIDIIYFICIIYYWYSNKKKKVIITRWLSYCSGTIENYPGEGLTEVLWEKKNEFKFGLGVVVRVLTRSRITTAPLKNIYYIIYYKQKQQNSLLIIDKSYGWHHRKCISIINIYQTLFIISRKKAGLLRLLSVYVL